MNSTRIILRRRVEYWGGWLVAVGSVLGPVTASYQLRVSSTTGYRLQATFAFVFIAWFAWRAIAYPSAVVTDDELIIVNRVMRHDVTWAAIKEIDTLPDMAVVLYDDRRIKVASGSGSVLGDLRGNKHLQRQGKTLEEFWERARDKQGSAPALRSRVDLHPLPFLILAAVLGTFAWLVQYLP